MSDSQEQSLKEDVAFAEIPKSSPQFYHCERERCALESLLRAGPGAFYAQLSRENLEPFLSPQEVTQLGTWAQEQSCGAALPLGWDDAEDGSGAPDVSLQYWPQGSDAPAPCLELGWPRRDAWLGVGSATVYSSPPKQQAPPVREVVRSLIQGAHGVVAVVTDRLTDNTVIGDLCAAASRGVPVYIILNLRSAQQSCISQRLKHQNIRVRILGGKSFCSRDGKMVTGELKENFLLVDVETVITGSYSLTWADAHLHRQLVMVLTGPVVASFDEEFRTLFAASLPIPNTWIEEEPPMKKEAIPFPFAETHSQPHLPLRSPSPATSPVPSDSFHDWEVDWEALGVTKYHCDPDETVGELEELLKPQQHLTPDPSRKDSLPGDKSSLIDAEPQYRPHLASRPSDAIEKLNRYLCNHKYGSAPKAEYQSLSPESKKEEERTQFPFYPGNDKIPGPESNPGTEPDVSFKGSKCAPKKVLILNVPEALKDASSALDDVLKRLQQRRGSLDVPGRGERTTFSEIDKSMNNLSHFDVNFSADQLPPKSHNVLRQTPAQALMRQRTAEAKHGITRRSKSFLFPTKPNISSRGFLWDWKQPTLAIDQGAEEK
ncbi:protein FAM83E [Scleropages formosus]|uniref:Family with sequence similarity 83 member E n=1 Tax=Scleropages formosus TaxID=113540 RepID=A0A8C9VAH2_SCLFO|nr:protein FAM83E-like [Scleropages formosus]XP_029103482.1 protein FAM83E-like [Scleropages formosus]XP_029103483.1 protein FAM83E-like [Scleropages formosus]